MKKISIILCSMIMIFGIAGFASAVPIQIGSNSTLTLTNQDAYLGWGSGSISYSATGIATPAFDLAVGASHNIDLFNVNIWRANSEGFVTVSIDFDEPLDSNIGGTGEYEVFGLFFLFGGSLTWDNPINIAYGAEGTGLLMLTLNDLAGINIGCGPLTISGTIENVNAPAPVPEPATMLLLGTGLLGLVAVGRKRFQK